MLFRLEKIFLGAAFLFALFSTVYAMSNVVPVPGAHEAAPASLMAAN